VKYENGEVRFNLYDVLGELSKTHRAEIIDALACQQEVIDEVMNQVLEGCTSLGSHGPKGCGGNPSATHGIDGARLRIAKAAGEIAFAEIAALSRAVERANASADDAWSKYHALLDGPRRGA
jgi:hypothetical protein